MVKESATETLAEIEDTPIATIDYEDLFSRLSEGSRFTIPDAIRPADCIALLGDIMAIRDLDLVRKIDQRDQTVPQQFWYGELTGLNARGSTLAKLASEVERGLKIATGTTHINPLDVFLNVYEPGDYIADHIDPEGIALSISLVGEARDSGNNEDIMPGSVRAERGDVWPWEDRVEDGDGSTVHATFSKTPRVVLVFRFTESVDNDWL